MTGGASDGLWHLSSEKPALDAEHESTHLYLLND
jgi:hypothetical protein